MGQVSDQLNYRVSNGIGKNKMGNLRELRILSRGLLMLNWERRAHGKRIRLR